MKNAITTTGNNDFEVIKNRLQMIDDGQKMIQSYAKETFAMITNALKGVNRDEYPNIQKNLIDPAWNAYTKTIVRIAFNYKALKIVSTFDLLDFITIKQMVTAVKKGRVEAGNIKNIYVAGMTAKEYKRAVLDYIKPLKKLTHQEFNLDEEIMKLVDLSQRDKIRVIAALTATL